MSTVKRTGGTPVHTCATGEERVAAFRSVVDRKSYAKIDGITVDLTTAGLVVGVHDKLGADNQARYRAMPTARMIDTALKLLDRTRGAK